MTEEEQHVPQGHEEAEQKRDEHGQDEKPERPVALRHGLEHGDEIKDRQREHPERRGKEDQQADPRPVGKGVPKTFKESWYHPWMPPPTRGIGRLPGGP